ncbi:cephalosporin hydroxylase [Halobacillus sp. A1]|uniref:CmcI family methyltransferase n=1 Tax=Halobacillus sp. A1 TaxID=2880262 RepID=UPI0020A6DA8B|nr:CmcI family methyltransferase [Halobacillus sp. A1]MCP3033468.1 cephalosporin hydroxylase [Halobacillus sp. A1]
MSVYSKSEIREAVEKTKRKVQSDQKGITTFFDNIILQEGISYLEDNLPNGHENESLKRALFTLDILGNERFVEISDRISNMSVSDLDGYSRICSQGARSAMSWRGNPLFKSVYDIAIYQMMINDIKPSTIIEIGSTETSLSWLKDLCDLNKLNSRIIGVDHIMPQETPNGVEFIKGDVQNISTLLPNSFIKSLPKPFIIIEDAHVHLATVLQHLDQIIADRDYLIIEDSILKQQSILQWAENQDSNYYVDTNYTDFFGINGTTAANSILTKRGIK